MKVFMDDERDPPPGEFDIVCRHSHEAIKLLNEGGVTFISLDHFMNSGEMTGLDVAKYILDKAKSGEIRKLDWKIHTQSTEFYGRIRTIMTQADNVWTERKVRESERYY